MSFQQIILESFEGEDPAQPEESADFKRGFEAAMDKIAETQQATTTKSLEELSSTLRDMAFGFEEARTYLSARLHNLLCQLAEVALPSILQESFGAHLNEVISTHFNTIADGAVQIAVTPDVEAALNAATTDSDRRFVFKADASLEAGQAIICDGDTSVMLDLPSLLETLQSTLASFDSPERKNSHG